MILLMNLHVRWILEVWLELALDLKSIDGIREAVKKVQNFGHSLNLHRSPPQRTSDSSTFWNCVGGRMFFFLSLKCAVSSEIQFFKVNYT